MPELTIKTTLVDDIIDIRHAVLRQNQKRSACFFEQDKQLLTTHFAAFLDSQIIGCASIYKESHPDFSLKQSWRIRGMAVLSDYRSDGVGKALLESCINHATNHKADVVWCNARVKAISFYQRSGFKIIGDEFEIEEIGPHFLMAKNLGIHSGKKRFFKLVQHLLADNRPIPAART